MAKITDKTRKKTSVKNKTIGQLSEDLTEPKTNEKERHNDNKISFEIETLELLLQKTLAHWKDNLDTENIKTDTIGDLEKLIKLRMLLIDETEHKKNAYEYIMTSVISAIKEVIDDSELRIKIFNRLKEIEFEK